MADFHYSSQDAISCSIINRTSGLGQALIFLQNLLAKKCSVARINILCTTRDFSIFLPVADTLPTDYGIVHRQSGNSDPPLLFPEKIMECCLIKDLSMHRNLLEEIIPNKNVPLYLYASMLRMPLFATGEHIFTIHFYSNVRQAFHEGMIPELKMLLEPLQNDLREQFAESGLFAPSGHSSTGITRLRLCPGLSNVFKEVCNAGPTDVTVLIGGETGVGKESVAEAIHELSARKKNPLIKVNCGSIPETLIESEFFGHEKGAFTGAHATRRGYFDLAAGGTLFLDEIGELSLASQVRLLRVLDSGTYYRVGNPRQLKTDVRLVAATNRNLERMVAEGKFRQDLYYRLAVYPISVPPLRERVEDIEILLDYFIQTKMKKMGIYVLPRIAPEEKKLLLQHVWPGNVRELEYVVERALIDVRAGAKNGRIKFRFLAAPEKIQDPAHIVADWPSLETLTDRYIAMALEKTGGRLSGPNGAAAILGIHYTTLYTHLKKKKKRRDAWKAFPADKS